MAAPCDPGLVAVLEVGEEQQAKLFRGCVSPRTQHQPKNL